MGGVSELRNMVDLRARQCLQFLWLDKWEPVYSVIFERRALMLQSQRPILEIYHSRQNIIEEHSWEHNSNWFVARHV